MADLISRFWAKVDKKPGFGPAGDCWKWIGARSSFGHGSFRNGDEVNGAHRFSFELHKGCVPEGMFVCHSCDIPRCVNPAHLFLGTRLDNHGDMCAKDRHTKPKGESNAAHKLTEKDILEIRKSPLGPSTLSKIYGVHRSTIHNIRSRQNWSHID